MENNKDNSKKKIPKKLKVGCLVDVPYVIYNNGHYSGICIDIWYHIVKNMEIDYEFVNAGSNYNKSIEDLSKNKFDLIIGAYAPTVIRSKLVYFSLPILSIGYGMAYNIKYHSLYVIMLTFKSIIIHIGVIFLLCSIFMFIYAKLEYNSFLEIKKSYLIVFMYFLQGGINKTPKKKMAKFFLVGITLVGLLYISSIIAYVSYNYLNYKIRDFTNIKDISNKKFVMLKGTFLTVNKDYKKRNIIVTEIAGDEEGAFKYYLENVNKYDGYIGSIIGISYFKKKYSKHKIEIAPLTYAYAFGAFALNKKMNTEIYDKINYEIVKLQENQVIYNVCSKYLPFSKRLCKI